MQEIVLGFVPHSTIDLYLCQLLQETIGLLEPYGKYSINKYIGSGTPTAVTPMISNVGEKLNTKV